MDSVDPDYGGRLRQMVKPDGHEHNLYYYRNPWNADTTPDIGVHSDLQSENWRVVLYNADGCFLKDLFPISQFNWKIVWDLHDPQTLYTLKGNELYRFNVTNGDAELMKSFAPLNLKPPRGDRRLQLPRLALNYTRREKLQTFGGRFAPALLDLAGQLPVSPPASNCP